MAIRHTHQGVPQTSYNYIRPTLDLESVLVEDGNPNWRRLSKSKRYSDTNGFRRSFISIIEVFPVIHFSLSNFGQL